MRTSAQWIAEAVSGRLVGNDVGVTGSVVTDSREAQAGSLYVARRGESADGHAFVAGAVGRGAGAVIVGHEGGDLVHVALPQGGYDLEIRAIEADDSDDEIRSF